MYTDMSTTMKPCGEQMCTANQLCMPHDMQCYPCDIYCGRNPYNFDKYCQNQCKDYIDNKLSDDDIMYGTYVDTTTLIWILGFAFFVFIVLQVKQFMKKRNENPETMIEDAIGKMSSGQTLTSIVKKKNERID